MAEPTRPPAAPSEALQKEVQNAVDSLKGSDLKRFHESVQTMTLERLDALAYRIRQENVTVTPEARKTLNEYANRLLQVQRIDQHLEALNTRLHLITLLPELRQHPRVVFAQRTQETAKKAGEVAHGLLRTARNVPGIGWLADGARFILGETPAELGRNILDGAKRLVYHLAAAPSFLGVAAGTPFAGRLVEWGRENLARLNAVRVIQEAVQAEGNPLITFDGRFSHAAWMRLPRDQRTPERFQELVVRYIDIQKKAGNGVPGRLIAVTMDALHEAEKKAEEEKKKQEETREKTLREAIQKQWGGAEAILGVEFGTAISARREGGKWKLTLPRDQIDEATGQPKAGSKAERLRQALTQLPDVQEIVIVDAGLELARGDQGIRAQLPIGESGYAEINLFAQRMRTEPRLQVMRPAGAELATDKPRVQFRVLEGRGVLAWNGQVERGQLVAFLGSNLVGSAATGQEWLFEAGSWRAMPAPAK